MIDSDIDDPAIAAADDSLEHRFGHVETAAKVGVDDFLPLLVALPLHGRIASDFGVVDQHVDRTKLGLDLGDAVLTSGEIGHVPFERRNAGAVGEGLGALVVAGIIGGDGHAHILKSDADRFANAARSAGDDRHSSHVHSPVQFRLGALTGGRANLQVRAPPAVREARRFPRNR